ncbi:E3 ubiquitin-protein ligase arih1-like isoform X2 [Hydractinia symbiolongicarpus]|uniref:E3 ubiquitin-protein ligase arih1-like isoform X2 n=1 Tax=Hydractinia symbiolongicarpus TaxID=13093 RepID=UPI00254E38EA|nr:E3 ubiquitin-protein ligase arih1-like isoform X2 [Hydractinia symbiolongicarpus]
MDSDTDDFMYDEDELSDPEDDQNDDFDISCDVEAAGRGESSSKRFMKDEDDFSFVCLTPESIVTTMRKCIDEVNSVFEIPCATARILLTHFKWDKEKLLERYYSSDQDTLFKEAHVISPHKNQQSSARTSRSGIRIHPKLECEICLCPVPAKMLTGLECGHVFCQFCWNEYLMMKILSENTGQHIFCPASKCDILVDENFVLKVLQDANIRSRYHKLIADSFVQSNRLMRWCPAPDCSNAIKAIYNDAKPVTCLCGFVFCFGCVQPSHDPVKCQWLKKWLKKCDDDSETSNWISANTKECPKCHVTIEKNGGCNHMVCRNTSCKADFCWVCLGPWQSHGSSWYNCNRYDEKDAQAARDAQAVSRAALERYLFYCNRYMNHLLSAKFEQKLNNQVKEKMENLQQMNMSWIEDNQRDLELATEQLSEYLERDINTSELKAIQEIKQKVQDKYRYCEQRRNVLLDHVHEGYEKDFWEYQESL